MQKLNLFITGSILLLAIACANQNKTNESVKNNNDTTLSTSKDTVSRYVYLEKIPNSTATLGDFPYVSLPNGYEYSSNKKERNFEEKYFFYSDSLVTKVSGKYYHATINKTTANGNDYEKSFVLKSYEDAIKKLGAVAIHSGYMPDKAGQLIAKEEPIYFKDLRSDYSMYYKQYLLKTDTSNIWFELGTVTNMDEVDFSVLQEKRNK